MNPVKLRPITRMLITIGELPTSYLISMTYEEQLLWLCNYIETKVIPAINTNADAVAELEKALVELREYVDNYFENLDLQEEIDKALDKMIESGKLIEIIAEFLNSNAILGFDNINSLKEDTDLIDGSFVRTLGKDEIGDGYGALYKITQSPIEGLESFTLDSGLYANLIKDYLNDKAMLSYNTINDLIHDENIKENNVVKVLNKDLNDRLSAYYKIFPSTYTDEEGLITLDNGLKAKKLYLLDNINEIKIHFPYRIKYGGDCIILEGSKNVIIDIGIEEGITSLINYLINNNIRKIDYLVITHVHKDHIGGNTGLDTLINNSNLDFSQCQFILNTPIDWTRFLGDASSIQAYKNDEQRITSLGNSLGGVIYPDNNTKIYLDSDNYLTFNNTTYPSVYYTTLEASGLTNLNNFSLVSMLTHRDKRFLFTADIEDKAEETILNTIEKVDVLKVMHHGANFNDNINFINKLNPDYSIIMNTAETFYQRCYTLLRRLNTTIYTLNESGNITINTNQEKLEFNSDNGYLNTDMGNIIHNGDDLNNFTLEGTYRVTEYAGTAHNIINCPSELAINNFMLKVDIIYANHTNKRIFQRLIANTVDPSYYVRIYRQGGWSNWVSLTPENWKSIPLKAGYTGFIQYRKDGQVVQVMCEINGVFNRATSEITDMRLPEGYRPKNELWAVARQSGSNQMRFIYFYNNGSINILDNLGSSPTQLRFSATYLIN